MSSLNEMNDSGDRLMTGHPYSQGGAIGSSSGGILNTHKSPSVSQNSNKFGETDKQHTTPYSQENSWDYVRDVEDIKNKVTPDEIIMGMTYEMKKQVIPNKDVARKNVVANLKKDKVYYSKLHMLGIEVDEKDEAILEILTMLKARKYSQKNGDFYK
jgi:hypothetical protein